MTDPFREYEEEPETLPAKQDSPTFNYHPSLAHDMACAMSDEEIEAIRLRYELTPQDLALVLDRPDFRREYAEWRQRLVSEGNSFKLKLRAMAEDFLPDLHRIMSSDLTAPSVRVSAFQYITKVAGLEPLKESPGEGQSGPKIVIEIANYSSPASQPTVVNVTPYTPSVGDAA